MKKIRPVRKLTDRYGSRIDKETMQSLENKINELIEENNRKNEEIRQIKSKLRQNAHYKRV